MRKKLLLFLIIFSVSSLIYADDKSPKSPAVGTKSVPAVSSDIHVDLEDAVTKVAAKLGKAVVSITAVIQEETGRNFYFSSPYTGQEDELFRRFFEDFFGNIPQEYGRIALGSGFIIACYRYHSSQCR